MGSTGLLVFDEDKLLIMNVDSLGNNAAKAKVLENQAFTILVRERGCSQLSRKVQSELWSHLYCW